MWKRAYGLLGGSSPVAEKEKGTAVKHSTHGRWRMWTLDQVTASIYETSVSEVYPWS